MGHVSAACVMYKSPTPGEICAPLVKLTSGNILVTIILFTERKT